MSESQKQNIIDVQNIMSKLTSLESKVIKELAEKIIDVKLIALVPDVIIDGMDITEKLMLIDLYSTPEEEREKEIENAILLDEILNEEGLI